MNYLAEIDVDLLIRVVFSNLVEKPVTNVRVNTMLHLSRWRSQGIAKRKRSRRRSSLLSPVAIKTKISMSTSSTTVSTALLLPSNTLRNTLMEPSTIGLRHVNSMSFPSRPKSSSSTRTSVRYVHVLVTGGVGFIGGHLAEAFYVTVATSPPLNNVEPFYDALHRHPPL